MGSAPGLAPNQQRTLGRLKPLLDKHRVYLAGGGAVAFHVEHRQSLDVDLFSLTLDIDLGRFADEVTSLANASVIGLTDATLRLNVDGIMVDVVKYPYPLLEPATPGPQGVLVASVRDLAAMKLAAVSQRGLRRDFWDLYELTRVRIGLGDACDAYLLRFGASHSDLYHVLRSLTYFDDAEREVVMPRGMSPALWQQVRTFFCHAAPLELRRRLETT